MARAHDTDETDADETDDHQTAVEHGGLTAGAARVDITPETGRSFEGYVRPDMFSEGVAIRLFARALVLDDGTEKVALVSADLLFGVHKEEVLDRVRSLGLTRETLFYVGTHTHAATEAGEWTAKQVADAIAAADANREPAVAGWGTATVTEVNRNRSLEGHLANHGLDLYPGTGSTELDPCGPDHPRDTTVRVLRVDSADGDPLAVWSQFPVHPTAFSPHNTVYSADLAGAATRHVAAEFPGDGPVVLFSNGAEGDLIPIYDAYNQHALADKLGRKLADGIGAAVERAGDSLSEISVAGRGTMATYDGQRIDGERVGKRALFGLPFLGGGENGPSFFYGLGLEGTRRPALLADSVQGRRIPVAPAPWDSTVELQALRVGDRLLLGVPGEPTVEVGRRLERVAAEAAPDDIEAVAVAGLANDYNGYFTTPEEYDQQHYEGGHTTFGKHSLALLRQQFAALAGELEGEPTSTDAVTASDSATGTVESPVGTPAVGELIREPVGTVERLSVLTVEWSGGDAGRDRPVGEPFVRLERLTDDDPETVATDLGLGFVWTVDDGQYTARYELPRTLDTGTYRLRVTGTGYDLRTDPFEVVPATTLRLRGVERAETPDGPQLAVHAQYPPPDPERHLRHRPVHPQDGSLSLVVDGDERTAEWDADADAWTASAEGVTEGDTVTVPEGGLEDSAGNHSGEGATLTVGDVEEVTWPANMGPGNGRPPGPFGIGTWPW